MSNDLLTRCACSDVREKLEALRQEMRQSNCYEAQDIIAVAYRGASINVFALSVECELCGGKGKRLSTTGQELLAALQFQLAQNAELEAAEKEAAEREANTPL